MRNRDPLRSLGRRLALSAVMILGLISIIATGGDDDTPVNQAPFLSNLTLAPRAVAFMTGAGRTTVDVTVAYTDPEADITSLRVAVAGGSSMTIPISSPLPGTSGQLTGQVELSTSVAGTFPIEVWATDVAGNDSNHVTAALRVQGSATLSNLTLSAGALDPTFSPEQTAYTAAVDFTTSSVTVTATSVEPTATLQVNGTAIASGAESPPIPLGVGENAIAIGVTSSDGALQATYTITVRRQATALLSDLSYSAGDFDQIFQPTLMDYTGVVSTLASTTTVTALPVDPNATVAVNGASVPAGEESAAITLSEGVNTIAITVTGADQISVESYAIEITRQSVASFVQQAYIKPSNTGDNFHFGYSVAFSGDTLAVGAPEESGVSGPYSGAVYVFTRDSAGIWSQQAHIEASNAEEDDHFGRSVALSGDTLAVGAPSEWSAATGIGGDQSDNSAPESGAVYIFTRDQSGTWSQQAYIKASNTEPIDEFGHSVALYGDTLAVGATGEDGNFDSNDVDPGAGAVYVFTRDAAASWSQQAYLTASNTDHMDRFGASVALADDILAVGATGEDSAATGVGGDESDNSEVSSGAVYVFARDTTGTWSQRAYIKASNTEAADFFGGSVALTNEALAVGAMGEDGAATGTGGDEGDNSEMQSGAVYLFAREATDTWAQRAYIKASNTEAGDAFGGAVALTKDALAVGASGEESAATGVGGDQSDNSQVRAGATYLFIRDAAGTWAQLAYVKASNTNRDYSFGWSVALVDDALAVGGLGDASAATSIGGDETDMSLPFAGAVYVFR